MAKTAAFHSIKQNVYHVDAFVFYRSAGVGFKAGGDVHQLSSLPVIDEKFLYEIFSDELIVNVVHSNHAQEFMILAK